MTTQHRLLLFIGSYAEAQSSGVYVYEFNQETGAMKRLDEVAGLKNPTFLNVDAAGYKLYSIAEQTLESGDRVGAAVSFSINPETGKLTELNREVNLDATTCHIQRDSASKFVIVSSYHGGKVGLVALKQDGTLGSLMDEKQHEGHGPDPERQEGPHVHSAFFSPDERYLFVNDLGLDRIKAYTLDKEQGKLVYHGETITEAGAGPRHLAFHPSGSLAFVINELNSTIVSYRYDAEKGKLEPIQSVSTLPEDFNGESITAEIVVSPDGRFVYGSNRGHDSIVVFAVDSESGKLSLVQHISSGGGHPRNFALTPDGSFLIAANRDSNNLVSFRVDQESGKLQPTGESAEVSKPVCVKPVYLD